MVCLKPTSLKSQTAVLVPTRVSLWIAAQDTDGRLENASVAAREAGGAGQTLPRRRVTLAHKPGSGAIMLTDC